MTTLMQEKCEERRQRGGGHLIASVEGALGLPLELPEEAEILGGSPQELAEGLHCCAEAGMDEVMLIVDPPTEAGLEIVAQAAELAAA